MIKQNEKNYPPPQVKLRHGSCRFISPQIVCLNRNILSKPESFYVPAGNY